MFRVVNLDKKSVLSEETKVANSLVDRLLGLLKPSNPRSLLFNTRFGIHTFGLQRPIDIVVLNNALRVVKLGISVSPNRMFFWNPLFNTILELPEGTIQSSSTKVGDTIQFINEETSDFK